ncbi:MAG: GHKL domain-containing protein, partial [Peptococcaceae bacterium]|nr:GHKL domain-containing protein [Peptococcaceae bacterium]
QTETGKTLITSKANKQEHGYGIPNIRRIVEKYSGMFRIESEQQKFKVKLFLPK